MTDNRQPTADELNAVNQEIVHWPAKAQRVTLVDTDGNSLKISPIEENTLGSECTGADGALGRVLTLTNTSETGAPISVWVEGQLIGASNITVAHLAADSTITFDSVNIFDTDTIRVVYYV